MSGNVHQTNSEGIEANSATASLASDGVRGWFITVEGIDGAGKSSHVEAMVQALQAQGQPVIHTREPGGTDLGEKIRALLLHESMDPLTEVLLAFASRRQHLREVIVPALLRGTTVVCDRFTDATFAYQGGGRGVAWALIEQLEAQVQGDYQETLVAMRTPAHTTVAAVPREFLQPDCTLWFDVPPAVAAARLEKARTPDRFEAQARDFFESVAKAYAQRAAADSARFVRIDADQDRTQVQAAVFAALYARGYLQG